MSKCPLCKSSSSVWRTLRDHLIEECGECRHRFTQSADCDSHIEQIYDDHYFTGGGAGYIDYLSQEELLRIRGQQYARMVARITRSRGTVLDVGAAAGFLLSGWLEDKWNGIGVEPNKSMAARAQNNGMDVRCGTFEDMVFPEIGNIDCIAMVQVISHFLDPCRALEKSFALLKPGGTLLVETWNRSSLIARYSGERWHEYSPPSVLHWFTPDALHRAAFSQGFTHMKSARSLRIINVGHAKSLLDHVDKSMPYRIARFMLRFVPNWMNIPYPGDDLIWALYRKPSR